jgi:hypothetical protein
MKLPKPLPVLGVVDDLKPLGSGFFRSDAGRSFPEVSRLTAGRRTRPLAAEFWPCFFEFCMSKNSGAILM